MSDINGTAGADTLNGTSGADNIDGLAGNDTLDGGVGDDKVTGGAGADTVSGGDGNDRLYSDIRLFGSDETNDPGSYPRNSADHFAEHDTLDGGIGDDEIFAGYGDTIDGGDGTDTLSINFLGATAGVTADFRVLATQSSLVVGGATIANIENVEYIDGSNFDDVLGIYQQSADEDAVVNGNGGNDTIYVSANAGLFGAQISGGDGNDTIDARGNTHGGNFSGGAGDDTIYTGESARATASGGDGNDTIYSWGTAFGDAGNDHIVMGNPLDVTGATPSAYGGDGSDVISVSTDPDFREPVDYSFAGEGGGDTLTGGDGNDYLTSVGFTGNGISAEDAGTEHDKLSGGDGNDHLFAGYGDDVNGGAGTDLLELSLAGATSGVTLNTDSLVSSTAFVLGGGTIQHMEGVARLYGSAYADTITVGAASVLPAGRIAVLGGDGDDIIIDGGARVDAVGGAGNDRFVAGALQDSFDGGDGADTVDYSAYAAAVEVNLGLRTGPDGSTFTNVENSDGSAFADILTGSSGDNVLHGNAGNDVLRGGGGNDVLAGGDGDDTLDGGAGGDDSIIGDTGSDTVSYASATAGVRVNLALTVAQNTVGAGKDTIADVENVQGSVHDDVLTGSTTANTLQGRAGNDELFGANGNDRLFGEGGDDLLGGGDGNDTLDGGLGNDTLKGSTGNDTASYASSGAGVTVNLALTAAQNTGGAGTDTISGVENLTGSAYNDTLTGNGIANMLSGGAGNDTLKGGNGNDILLGGAGNDTLNGNTGADAMTGGAGDDLYYVDNVGDTVTEASNGGHDRVSSTVTYTLGPQVEDLTLTGTAAINATGNNLANVLTGNGGANVLNGKAGADTMSGGLGDDLYYVDNAGDIVRETSASGGLDKVSSMVSFTLGAHVEQLTLTGTGTIDGTGNVLDNMLQGNGVANVLKGLAGADTLRGGAGDDTLQGGSGQDMLTGGTGNDKFVFESGDTSPAHATADHILDFATGDHVDLHFIDANTTLANNQAFHFVATAAFSHTAGELHYSTGGGVTWIEGDTNGDGTADFAIYLAGNHTLDAGDFIL